MKLTRGEITANAVVQLRDRLLDAGVEVFGTVGYAGSTIKSLCKQAGLSERYFYESYASRENLLREVYDDLSRQLTGHIMTALQVPCSDVEESVRAGLAAVVNFMLDDLRHARIMLVEIVGISAELEVVRHASLTAYAAESMRQLLRSNGIDAEQAHEQLAQNPDDAVLAKTLDFSRLTAIAMVGGVNNMLIDAVLGGTTGNTAKITDVAFLLFCGASNGINSLLSGKGQVRLPQRSAGMTESQKIA